MPLYGFEQEGKLSELCASVGLRAMLVAINGLTDLCSSSAGQQLLLSPGR